MHNMDFIKVILGVKVQESKASIFQKWQLFEFINFWN